MTCVAALVPLKLSSRRLPNKNFLRLGDRPLAYHVFDTLSQASSVEEAYCYSSQPQVMDLLPEGTRFLARPTTLDRDDVKANELFRYAVERIEAEVIVLCHATSPFIKRETIETAVEKVVSGEYACAAAAKRLQTYCWYEGRPLNYEPTAMSQTQDLSPVHAETSGVYVFRKQDYLEQNTRITGTPFLVEVDDREAVDIDEPGDFNMALSMLHHDPDSEHFKKDRFFVDMMNAQSRHRNLGLVAFDLDGVLVDSLAVMERAWLETMRQVGLSVPFSDYAGNLGYSFRSILENLGIDPHLHDEVERCYHRQAMAHHDKVVVYPGVSDALRRLNEAGMGLAVVTGKNRERTSALMAEHFPDVDFACVSTPEDVQPGRGKPHPDQLLYCALKSGVDPYNSVYIGDMPVDRTSAKRAGFQFVHAGWGYGDLASTEDIWFNSIADFADFLLATPET